MEAQTILRTTPQRWENLTENVSAELLTRVPAPGEWSALDCLLHLIEVETFVMPVRVKYSGWAGFCGFQPGQPGKKDQEPVITRPDSGAVFRFAQGKPEGFRSTHPR